MSIKFENINKIYENGYHAVHNFNLKLTMENLLSW